jgi:hypothetical protein
MRNELSDKIISQSLFKPMHNGISLFHPGNMMSHCSIRWKQALLGLVPPKEKLEKELE